MNNLRNNTPPAKDAISSGVDCAVKKPTPLANQAAKISCYGALLAIVLSGFPRESLPLWSVFIVGFVAFCLGIIGFISGVKRRTAATIRMATLGTLLSGILLALLAYSAFFFW